MPAAAGVALAVLALGRIGAFGSAWTAGLDRGVHEAILAAASAACLLGALRRREGRAAWALLGVGMASFTLGDLYYLFEVQDMADPPFPSFADLGWLGIYPAAFGCLLALARRRTAGAGAELLLDGAIGALTVAAVGAALVFGPVLAATGGSPFVVATTLAYPLADLLLAALTVSLLAVGGWRAERSLALMAAGLLLFAAGDIVYAYGTAAGTYVPGGIVDMTWPMALVLLAAAPWVRPSARLGEVQGRRLLVAPATFATASLGILVVDHFTRVEGLGFGLAGAALLAVVARMTLTVRTHLALVASLRVEAMTDALTRLGNRRQLVADLDRAVEGDASPLALVLYDLGGFKAYNDRFGHVAGDELLVRLGRRLEAAVVGRGGAYRLGGDEFCVLGSPAGTGEAELADVGLVALTEAGDGYAVSSSWGSVALPVEAGSTSDALVLADQRMYAAKRARRTPDGSDRTRRLVQVVRPA